MTPIAYIKQARLFHKEHNVLVVFGNSLTYKLVQFNLNRKPFPIWDLGEATVYKMKDCIDLLLKKCTWCYKIKRIPITIPVMEIDIISIFNLNYHC